MSDNSDLIREKIIYADEINVDDEWMQEDIWDDIYQKEGINVNIEMI